MNLYQTNYFNEGIFDTDYALLAKVIFDSYSPKTVIEFGCGPGHLTRALSDLNVTIQAIDGFSAPDFASYPNVNFTKVDLNNEAALADFVKNKKFDLAICTEVAEHLNPESSEYLIKYLTQCAPVVVFSAAIPGQNGHGHINCKPRGFWNDLFKNSNFQLIDSLRGQIRNNENLAVWYRLNLLDYVSKDIKTIDYDFIIKNLVDAESYSSSMFYNIQNENLKNIAYLNYPLVKEYFKLRNFLKALLKK